MPPARSSLVAVAKGLLFGIWWHTVDAEVAGIPKERLPAPQLAERAEAVHVARHHADVRAPVARAFVPSAVGRSPRGVCVPHQVKRVIEPVPGFRNVLVEDDAALDHKRHHAAGMARERRRLEGHAPVQLVDIAQAKAKVLDALLALVIRKQLADPIETPGPALCQIHGRLVIVEHTGRALRIPSHEVHEPTFSFRARGFVAGDRVCERATLHAGREGPHGTENLLILVTPRGSALGQPWWLGVEFATDVSLGRAQRIGHHLLDGRVVTAADLLHELGCEEHARVCLGNECVHLLHRRPRVSHWVASNGEAPRLAPRRHFRVLDIETVAPVILARFDSFVRSEDGGRRLVGLRIAGREFGICGALHAPLLYSANWQPTESGRR